MPGDQQKLPIMHFTEHNKYYHSSNQPKMFQNISFTSSAGLCNNRQMAQQTKGQAKKVKLSNKLLYFRSGIQVAAA